MTLMETRGRDLWHDVIYNIFLPIKLPEIIRLCAEREFSMVEKSIEVFPPIDLDT